MADLEAFFFGPPRLTRNGKALPIERRKGLGLLAYMAVSGSKPVGYPHSRDILAALFWPASDQGRSNLSRIVADLNKALGQDWSLSDRDTIALNPGATPWVDVLEFRALLASARQHLHAEGETCLECKSLLQEAVSLFKGEFMAGFSLPDCPDFDDWQRYQAERLGLQAGQAMDRLAAAYAAGQEWPRAIELSRRRLELDPLFEPAHRDLMRWYASADQRASALAQFDECRRLLAEELGVEPDPETMRLLQTIKSGELRVAHSGVSQSSPAATQASPPRPLPPFLVEPLRAEPKQVNCVGRDPELAWLEEQLQLAMASQGRIAFISGEAGQGKSTLLSAFARLSQEKHVDLVAVGTACNALTGTGDPFFPFRDIMSQLAGDVETTWASGDLTSVQARRLWQLAPRTAQALAEHGAELVNTLITERSLASRLDAFLWPEDGPSAAEVLKQIRWHATQREVEQSQLFEQFFQVLHALAAHQPLLLMIDDLQWADRASIALLFHLARRLVASRILVIGVYRPTELALDQHPLEPVRNELMRHFGEVELRLGSRTEQSGRAFIDALLDGEPNTLGEAFRQALFERTRGQPLFAVELLRDMQSHGNLVKDANGRWAEGPRLAWDALPARVGAVIAQRLSRLTPELSELLTVASVEGERFTAQVLARVLEKGELPVLRQLSQELGRKHRLVREREEIQAGGQHLSLYQFGHALFQQYLYGELSPGEKRVLHARVGAALEALYGDEIEAVTMQLALHYSHAGDRPKAIAYARAAALRAEEMHAYEVATQYLNNALGLILPGEQLEVKLDLLERLADLRITLGRRPEAIPIYQEALALRHSLPETPPMALVRLHRKIGEAVAYMTWYADRQQYAETGRFHLQAALDLVKGAPPHSETVKLLNTLAAEAWLLQPVDGWDTGERHARAAVEIAEQLDSPADLVAALEMLSTVYGARGKFRERLDLAYRRLALGRQPGFDDRRELAKILQQTGFALAAVGDYESAIPLLEEAEEMSQQVQAIDQQFRALRYQAYSALRLDRWDDVLRIEKDWRSHEDQYPLFAERVGPTCFMIAMAATVYALRGDLEAAAKLRQEAVEMMIANAGPAQGWARDNRY